MKKRIIASIVAVFMLMTLLPTISMAAPWDGTSDWSWYSEGPTEFTITTAEQFAGIAAIQNGIAQNVGGPNASSLVGKTIYLGADIVLNENLTWDASGIIQGTPRVWSPINKFSGTLDGNGHTISGIYVDTEKSPANNYYGLFAFTWRGNIRNLNITNSYLLTKWWAAAALVVGRNQGGIIENVNVTNSYLLGQEAAVSGISGENGVPHEGEPTIGQILNCSISNTTITTNYGSGGIAQSNVNGSIIKDCTSSATINTGGETGGIVATNKAFVDGCGFTGTIATTGDPVGGIAGFNGTAAGSLTGSIINCYNIGAISSTNWVSAGGIAGHIYTEGSVIKNCYSAVSTISNLSATGGITGYFNKGTIENCYSSNTLPADNSGGIAWGDDGTANNCYYQTHGSIPLFNSTSKLTLANNDFFNESYQLNGGGSLVDALNTWVTANGADYKTWVTGDDGYPVFGVAEEPTNPSLSIADGVVTVSNAPETCVLIIASYNGTRLIDAKAISNATNDYTIANEISTTGATSTKAFLWNNTDDITPLCEAAVN